jgi:hypothetical protein
MLTQLLIFGVTFFLLNDIFTVNKETKLLVVDRFLLCIRVCPCLPMILQCDLKY